MPTLSPTRRRPARWLPFWLSVSATLLMAAACGDDLIVEQPNDDEPTNDGGTLADAGQNPSAPDAGNDAGQSFGGLRPNTTAALQDLDLFGVPGHRFWIEVSETQLERMNSGSNEFVEDLYSPGSSATYADHVVVQDGESASIADYGKIQVRLVGESSARAFDEGHIPNFKIDANEFQPNHTIGSFEHIRLNNGQVGSIFREHLAHRIYRALDYPALRSTYAFVGSNVWGEDTWIPMILIEVYKRRFCTDNAELLGGECLNMWEFPGDIGQGGGFPGGPGFPIDLLADDEARDIIIDPAPGAQLPPDACQVDDCDNTRLDDFSDALSRTYRGPGFKVALEDFIDWDRFHEFQCLSWIMWVGDDPLHNQNNNLIIERDDGRLIWAPYSVDISAGQSWYTNVPLTGTNSLSSGCQMDADCWADTIATCEDMIQRFDDLNPEEMVDETLTLLTDLGMMRPGDVRRAEELREWFVYRQEVLLEELEYYRYLPDEFGNCPNDLLLCADNTCGTFEQCEKRCGFSEYWCESKGRCVAEFGDFCPACPEDAPLWCDLQDHRQCVASFDACYALCEETPGYAYCPMFEQCALVEECTFGGDGDGDGDSDGGPSDGGD